MFDTKCINSFNWEIYKYWLEIYSKDQMFL